MRITALRVAWREVAGLAKTIPTPRVALRGERLQNKQYLLHVISTVRLFISTYERVLDSPSERERVPASPRAAHVELETTLAF